jgi:hypothetical protein
MSKHIPIIKVDYGIASHYGDLIEINRKLDYYPELKQSIIHHEQRHTPGRYSIKDFLNDFNAQNSNFREALKFCLINKEAIINYFPLMYSYHLKEWSYNSSSLPPMFALGAMFVLFFRFTLKLPVAHLIFGWISVIGFFNLILLIYTHRYVKRQEKVRKNTKIALKY